MKNYRLYNLLESVQSSSVICSYIRSWEDEGSPQQLGLTEEYRFVGLHLIQGRMYRSAVSFCHQDGCFMVNDKSKLTTILKYVNLF